MLRLWGSNDQRRCIAHAELSEGLTRIAAMSARIGYGATMVRHGKTALFAAIAGAALVGAACSATVTDSSDPGGNGGSDAGGTGANAGRGGTDQWVNRP